ncbi:MAG TPA: hypothetical protein VKE51_03465 [Vicinamibacterales bacterium]|nr:hypothetical protein [Vicinamibacterales bacterium]
MASTGSAWRPDSYGVASLVRRYRGERRKVAQKQKFCRSQTIHSFFMRFAIVVGVRVERDGRVLNAATYYASKCPDKDWLQENL